MLTSKSAHVPSSSGWPKSTPRSTSATRTPAPVNPFAFASRAWWICEEKDAVGVGPPPPRSEVGLGLCMSRVERAPLSPAGKTSFRARTSSEDQEVAFAACGADSAPMTSADVFTTSGWRTCSRIT